MEPAVLLLDEPLGALDERLRLEMQAELIELRRRTGGTFILVTHSQEEAITMSDRIVLMRAGGIEQVGTPRALFARPATEFAARFMGVENVLSGTIETADGEAARIRVGDTVLTGRPVGNARALVGGAPGFAAFRAEHLRVDAAPAANAVRGETRPGLYKGSFRDVPFLTPLGELTARLADESVALPSEVLLSVDPGHCLIGSLDRDASA
jgi:ABC-type Fe3+/spermidine/putrescine transport system ATPase subunit